MIWYVEDDASIRDIGMYALNSAGFETRGFEDGLSFWEALKKEKPELIVLDVMLPGMDGIEILSKMKHSVEYSTIPVIMATAKGQEYDRIRGLDLGAAEFIHKQLLALRDQGVGILLISEELEEIINLSDRIAVIFKGQIQRTLGHGEATQRKLGMMMAGVKEL